MDPLFQAILPKEPLGYKPSYDDVSLLHDHLQGFSKLIRPVQVQNLPIHINISLMITTLQNVNIINPRAEIGGYFFITWHADILAWNPQEYGNLTHTYLPTNRLWLPDLGFNNILTEDLVVGKPEKWALIYHNGTVLWVPYFVSDFTCSGEIFAYPFDYQYCYISISRSVSTSNDVVINIRENVNLSSFRKNSQFSVILYGNKEFHPDDDDFYEIVFYVYVRRLPHFLVFYLMVPLLMQALLCSSSYLLHPGDEDKLTLAVTALLSFTVFLKVIDDDLPKATRKVPLTVVYVLCMLAVGFLTVLGNVAVRTVYKLGETYDIDDFHERRQPAEVDAEDTSIPEEDREYFTAPRSRVDLSQVYGHPTSRCEARSHHPETNKPVARWKRCILYLLIVSLKEQHWNDLACSLNKVLLYFNLAAIFSITFIVLMCMAFNDSSLEENESSIFQ